MRSGIAGLRCFSFLHQVSLVLWRVLFYASLVVRRSAHKLDLGNCVLSIAKHRLQILQSISLFITHLFWALLVLKLFNNDLSSNLLLYFLIVRGSWLLRIMLPIYAAFRHLKGDTLSLIGVLLIEHFVTIVLAVIIIFIFDHRLVWILLLGFSFLFDRNIHCLFLAHVVHAALL